MKKSNQERHKAGIGNATEIAICDTPDERTLRSRQVQRKPKTEQAFWLLKSFRNLVNLPVLHALQCIERIKALSCCVNLGGTADFFRP